MEEGGGVDWILGEADWDTGEADWLAVMARPISMSSESADGLIANLVGEIVRGGVVGVCGLDLDVAAAALAGDSVALLEVGAAPRAPPLLLTLCLETFLEPPPLAPAAFLSACVLLAFLIAMNATIKAITPPTTIAVKTPLLESIPSSLSL